MTRHLSIYSLSSFMILHFPCIRPKCNCMSNFDLTFCPQILQLVGFPVLFPVCVFWTCKNTLSSIPFLKQILQQNSGFFFDPICNWTPVLNQDSWSSVCVSRQSKSGCRSGINKVCLFVVFKAGLNGCLKSTLFTFVFYTCLYILVVDNQMFIHWGVKSKTHT